MKVTVNKDGHFYTSQGGCLMRLVVLSIAVMAGAWLLPGITVKSAGAVILTALVISILNNTLRPILIVIALPSNSITLGITLFVINTLIIMLASGLVSGFHVDHFGWAVLFSLVIMVVNYLLELPNRYLNRQNLNQQKTDSSQSPTNDTDDDGFTPYEEVE